MSKPIISNFDFGQPASSSDSQNKEKVELLPDELRLVDAFWIKDGMKIRFIPHQMKDVDLIVVFSLQYDNGTHDREKASFNLEFEVPGTRYEDNKEQIIINEPITYDMIKNNRFSDLKIARIFDDRGYDCYYYKIDGFSNKLFCIDNE